MVSGPSSGPDSSDQIGNAGGIEEFTRKPAPKVAATSGQESAELVAASFPSRRQAEHMVASLGHRFRREARRGHVAAFVVTTNRDGTFSVAQSRVITASGLVVATMGIIIATIAGLVGMISALRGAKTTVEAARVHRRHVGSGVEKLAEFLGQGDLQGALTLIRCSDKEVKTVLARADDRANHYWHGSRSEFLAALDRLGREYDWARPAAGNS